MTKKNQDFEMWQGESKRIKAPIVDSDGNVLSITGATVKWQMYETIEKETASVTKETGSGISIIDIDGTDDGVQIDVDEGDTDDIKVTKYYHECRVVDVLGHEEVVFIGTIDLKRSRTVTV